MHEIQKYYLDKLGVNLDQVDNLPSDEVAKATIEVTNQHPEHSPEEAQARALARVAYKYYGQPTKLIHPANSGISYVAVQGNQGPKGEKGDKGEEGAISYQKVNKIDIILKAIIILLLMILCVKHSHAQIRYIQIRDASNNQIATYRDHFILQCGSGSTCTANASGLLTIVAAGGGGGSPGGSNTQIQYNDGGVFNGTAVGTYIKSSTQFNFQVGTHFNFLDPTDTTKIAELDASGITTGTTRSFKFPNVTGDTFLVATNIGTAGQMCGSNADGSCTFSDPVVSGPDAPGAVSTKNPVQVAGNDGTDVRAIRTDSSGDTEVVFASTPTVNAAQSGTWTVQPGNTANTTPWLATINQGGNSATVTASNALKIDGSAVTQPVSGTITAKLNDGSGNSITSTTSALDVNIKSSGLSNQSVNLNQVGGNAITTTDNGTQATAPASTASSTVAVTACNILSAASTNSTNCKGSAGNFYGFEIYNTTTTVYYLRLYNTASAPTCSSATGFIRSIPIQPASAAGGVGGAISNQAFPVNFNTGISFCITGGSSSTDNTNAATGIFGEIRYH